MATKLQPNALYAALDSGPVSPEAKAYVDSFVVSLERHEDIVRPRVNQRRDTGRAKLAFAVGAFTADLLGAASDPEAQGWVYRSMRKDGFAGEHVGYRVFKDLVDDMLTLRFLEAHEENEMRGRTKGPAALWRATPTLLGIAKAHGIVPEEAHQHFRQKLPKTPIELKSASKGHGREKVRGKPMPVPKSPEALAIKGLVKRLNEFLDGFEIKGGDHRGYTRIFNEGDHKDFQWNRGGRLYSKCHGTYQSLSKAIRHEMTIGGEPVVEIDVRSSFILILHGLCGHSFDASVDAYDLDGFLPRKMKNKPPRSLVKAWTVRTIGLGKPWTRWPEDMIDDYHQETDRVLGRDYPISLVRDAMIAKHPILGSIERLGHSWATLMFNESEAILGAMVEMMDDHQAPSLSVHDSLIVRARDVEIAKRALIRNYKDRCGLEPYLDEGTSTQENHEPL